MSETNKSTQEKEMNLQERLAYIQNNLKAPKNQKNSFGNYNYRSCEDILEAVKPLLGDATLVVFDEIVHFKSDHPPVIIRVTDSKGNVTEELSGGDRFYIKATARLSVSNDGSIDGIAYARESETKRGMDEAQITGASSSYARKYALNGLFAIDDTKDADTQDNTASKQSTRSPQKASQVQLMEKYAMNTSQQTPKCPTCKYPMLLVERKDNSGIFWMCPNWRNKGCKGLNVEDVDIDGTISAKPAKAVST